MPERAPSGEQFELSFGEQRATVVEVGGGLRCYSDAGRDVLEPYPLEAICDGGHGAPLAPWPNRLGGGSYEFDGRRLQLPLSEPTRGNAIHGLLRWRPWRATEQAPSRVVMAARLDPQPGYPFALDLSLEYELAASGLTVSWSAGNIGDAACPFGYGQHPYLSPGAGTVDGCTLELAAGRLITVDADSRLPNGTTDPAGGPLDFSTARTIGAAQLDDAYTALRRDEKGAALVRLGCPDGCTVELWADTSHEVLQVFTGDTLAPARRRTGLAVEPMTCPSDAFRSGEHLLRIEPGHEARGRWGVRLLRRP